MMSKRIGLIGNCTECFRSAMAQGSGIKGSRYLRICTLKKEECPNHGIPSWCPLPEVPEREEIPPTEAETREKAREAGIGVEAYLERVWTWNKCLDKIGIER